MTTPIFMDKDYLGSLLNTDKEALFYGGISDAPIASGKSLGTIKGQYSDAYDDYVAQKALWEQRPTGRNGLAQWEDKWNALVPMSQANLGGESGMESVLTEFKPNEKWNTAGFDPSTASVDELYNYYASKYDKPVNPNTVEGEDTGNEIANRIAMQNLGLRYSDHEAPDMQWGQYNAQVVKDMMKQLYPNASESDLDQAALNTFMNMPRDEYQTYSVYHGADKIGSNISNELAKIIGPGTTTYSQDDLKQQLNTLYPSYSKQRMQAIAGHKASDNADDESAIGPVLSIASLIPGVSPFAMAANAAYQASQGNLLGAALSAAGAYGGFSGVDSGVSGMGNELAKQGVSFADTAKAIEEFGGVTNPLAAELAATQSMYSGMPITGIDALDMGLKGATTGLVTSGGDPNAALVSGLTGGLNQVSQQYVAPELTQVFGNQDIAKAIASAVPAATIQALKNGEIDPKVLALQVASQYGSSKTGISPNTIKMLVNYAKS